ncbi:MAG: cytochrome c oxidase assembly protein [Thermoleophilia bacterium]|nr:cytochrome c oxidase assembly protein [Thermoleophilia bacterium]
MSSPWAPTFEPLFIVGGAAAAWAYARAARHDPPGRGRIAAFTAGIVLIVLALNSPLETIAIEYLLLFHLLQNVIITDWAPPLLILGLTPGMRSAIAERGGRPFAFVTRPTIAFPIWLIGWYTVHLAGVFETALRNPILLNVEHLFMIAIGLLFWWPVLSDAPRAVPTLGRIAYIFAAFVGSEFLGLALTFAPPLYAYYEDLPVRLWGISAAQDQNLGGILMTTEQAIVFFAMIVWLLVVLFREEDEAERELQARQRAEGLL